MPLTVRIPVESVSIAEVDALSHSFRSFGGSNHMDGTTVIFPFSIQGEDFFTAEAYAVCNAFNLSCEGGMFYAIIPDPAALTPSTYPDSTDADGNQLSYADYFNSQSQYPLADGTWLFRVVRGTEGLSDADRRIYQDDLGTLLVKAYGLSLIPDEVVA